MRERYFYTYIMTDCSRHPYTGFTGRLLQRRAEHVEQEDDGSYTAQYHLLRLVYFEADLNANNAIAREKQIKRWSRAKKIALIESVNPKWDDLAREWGTLIDLDKVAAKIKTKVPRLAAKGAARSG